MFWLIRVFPSISRLPFNVLGTTRRPLAIVCGQEVPTMIEKDADRFAVKIAGDYCGIILKRDYSPTLVTYRGHSDSPPSCCGSIKETKFSRLLK